jgi:hypothetical protein
MRETGGDMGGGSVVEDGRSVALRGMRKGRGQSVDKIVPCPEEIETWMEQLTRTNLARIAPAICQWLLLGF